MESQGQKTAIIVTCCVQILVYLALLAWACLNIKLYLVAQKRYKTSAVLNFYILAVVIILCQVLSLSEGIALVRVKKPEMQKVNVSLYDESYVIAVFARAIMGFLQVASLAQLVVKLKNYNEAESLRLFQKIDRLTLVVSCVTLVTGFIFAFIFIDVFHRMYDGCPTPETVCECGKCHGFYSFMVWYGWITGVIYTVLTVAGIVSYTKLIKVFRERFFSE